MLRILLWLQVIYTFITAIWPIIHIESFMAVTGPKNDIWLVKTVGALLIPIAITLGVILKQKSNLRLGVLLGRLTALMFVIVDFYYALTDTISNMYLLDGGLEIVFLITWIVVWKKNI